MTITAIAPFRGVIRRWIRLAAVGLVRCYILVRAGCSVERTAISTPSAIVLKRI